MNNSTPNDVVSKLLYAEATFMEENLPEAEYLHAVEVIDDAFKEIGSDYWKYSRLLRNIADRLQENGCYDLTGHDNALAELAKRIPVSFNTINRLVVIDFKRFELTEQLVDSFADQVFDIQVDDEWKFVDFMINLCKVSNHHSGCVRLLDSLLSTPDGRLDDLKKNLLSKLFTDIAGYASQRKVMCKWIKKNTQKLIDSPWSPNFLSRLTMDIGIQLFMNGAEDFGKQVMKYSGKSARAGDLIVREQLTGIVVSKVELKHDYLSDLPLLSYLCWTANPEFDHSWVSGKTLNAKHLDNAIEIASKHTGGVDEDGLLKAIEVIAHNTRASDGLTDMMDRHLFRRREEKMGVIKSVLYSALSRGCDSMSDINIIARMMHRHQVSIDASPIREQLDATLKDELSTQKNNMKFLCLFNQSFISLFTEDLVIDCLNKAAIKASANDIGACLKVIPEEMVMKVGGLKRAILTNDLGM
jgi:hypothetical protein